MFSDPASALGAAATAYSLVAGGALLLQVRTMRRRRSSRDVSLAYLASTSGGYLIWLLYGLGLGSVPLIASDAIGLFCSLIAIGVALRLRPGRRPPTTKARKGPNDHTNVRTREDQGSRRAGQLVLHLHV